MKKQLMALLVVVVLVLGVCFAACNSNAAVIDGYVFDKNNQAVYDDFVLPKNLGDDENPTQVKWTSSDSTIIKITERDSDYIAEIVNFPDEAKDINLTLSAGKNEKVFTVTVNPLAASDFARAYTFPQLHSKVAVDFTLDTSVQYKGKTATISWEVVTGDPYIKLDGNKCVVDHQNESNPASLRATFTYGTGKTATRTYDFTVAKEPTHEEAMHRWHTIAPMDQDLPIKGYIVGIIAAYDAQYGNASFYMVCEDYCSAYYVYRVKLDAANGAKVAVGNYVTITGTKNSIYNGLYETSAGGKCVVDDTKKIKEDYVYAIDNDLFADAPTASYHVSDYVSLTNWTVKSVENKPTATDKNLMVLTKNDVDITLRVSKNVLETATNTAPNFADIAALCDTIKVNDVVSVKGLMGYYNGYQLFITKASDLTKTTADAEGTVYPGLEVKQTVADIKEAITDNGLNKLVTANKTITMPTGSGNISVVYSKYSDSNAVALNDNVITVTPGKAEDVNIKATVKYGDAYTTMVIFNIKSEGKTDAEMVAVEKEALTIDDIEKAGDVTLATKGATYEDVAITWELATTTAATLAGNKLTVATLPAAETEITLTATLKKGDVTETKEIKVTIAAAPVVSSNEITLTAESLELATSYPAEVTSKTINEVAFSYQNLLTNTTGNYTGAIQVKAAKKYNSSDKTYTDQEPGKIWNTAAFASKIVKIEIVLNSNSVGYANTKALVVSMGTAVDNMTKTVDIDTVKNQTTYTIEAGDGEYTFFCLEDGDSYANYIDSIIITLAD